MPSFGFYASRADASLILDFVLRDLGCRVLDAYSEPDTPLAEYQQATDVLAAYRDVAQIGIEPRAIHLAVWRSDFGPQPHVRRVELQPGAVAGHTHRFTVEGWGLLNLQFATPQRGRLGVSHLSANNEARAKRWEDANADQYGLVAAWEWPVVARVMRQVQYHLAQRLAVGRHGSRPVLPGAADQVASGLSLAEV